MFKHVVILACCPAFSLLALSSTRIKGYFEGYTPSGSSARLIAVDRLGTSC